MGSAVLERFKENLRKKQEAEGTADEKKTEEIQEDESKDIESKDTESKDTESKDTKSENAEENERKSVSDLRKRLAKLRKEKEDENTQAREKRPDIDEGLKKQQEKNGSLEVERPEDAADCKACEGSGQNSRGGACVPCKGRGWIKPVGGTEESEAEEPEGENCEAGESEVKEPEEKAEEKIEEKQDENRSEEKPRTVLREGTVTTHRHYKRSGEIVSASDDQEKIEILPFEGEVAAVGVEKALTIQPRQFESIKVSAHVSLPCYVEEVEQAMQTASRIAAEFVAREIKEAKEEFKG